MQSIPIAITGSMFTGSAALYRGHRAVGIDVASPGTVSQLAYRVFCGSIFSVRAASIVSRVAAGTVGSIAAIGPADYLIVGRVTHQASHTGSVVSGVVAGDMAVVGGRYPASCGMAFVTLDVGGKVVARFTGGIHAIVAGDTVAGDASVVEYCRYPAEWIMAVVTVVAGGNVLRRFSARRKAVVATAATAGNGCVIHERNW